MAKTGLGSSAAMTTAVVAGLLQYFGRVDLPLHGVVKEDGEADLELVHSVAQAAHCAAQGKIGSGFDVSCAVYGSQRYVRFSPSVLSSAQVLNFTLITFLTGFRSSSGGMCLSKKLLIFCIIPLSSFLHKNVMMYDCLQSCSPSPSLALSS